MISRGQLPYLRQEITIKASNQPLALAEVQLFHFPDTAARVVGTVAGSPIVIGDFYVGFEHPLSYSTIEHGEVIAGLKRTLPLASGQSITYSSVVGVARPGQMRRDFLAYLEQERAHPYRTFLHYNTWYDLGFGERFSSAGVLNRINSFGEELVRKRNVTMDSFLMDDGWDDTSSLWGFNSGFPDGLTSVHAAAARNGFGIGVWMSPWGGYQKEKQERITYGKSQGYEIVDGGYALSGPRYYEKFEATCLAFVKRYGVNQFKFDGTGNAGQVFAGSLFDSDFSAAIHLIERIRQENSEVFINLTTGTKPSPFWLRYADSIWRSGEDHDFAGEGSWRQKWITYRDAQTYRNIVQGGPLFPLNSLMLHGLIYADKAEHLSDDPNHDFAAEVRSYFGSGTQLQEMYITPALLSATDWDVLGEAARWSRSNASTLRDTHWVGGDPGKGEPYGWASWNADAGIIVLRNPSPHRQPISIDVQNTFELPPAAKQLYSMHSPWIADAGIPSIQLAAHHPHIFELEPFQVLTLQSRAER
ncbi:MAG: enterotoxin [Acidobacteriota bacterium]|nr:enterotoxin [Acidobacteriota bacterium]